MKEQVKSISYCCGCFLLALLISCSPIKSNKDLTRQTLTLDYNAISCTCAQWSESKYQNNPDKREYVYLERANDTLIIADTLFDGQNIPIQISVSGQFTTASGFPKGYEPAKGSPKPGKVFRYESIQILKN